MKSTQTRRELLANTSIAAIGLAAASTRGTAASERSADSPEPAISATNDSPEPRRLHVEFVREGRTAFVGQYRIGSLGGTVGIAPDVAASGYCTVRATTATGSTDETTVPVHGGRVVPGQTVRIRIWPDGSVFVTAVA